MKNSSNLTWQFVIKNILFLKMIILTLKRRFVRKWDKQIEKFKFLYLSQFFTDCSGRIKGDPGQTFSRNNLKP